MNTINDDTIRKIALLAAFSAFLGIFENMLPLPVPFFRLGIANIPVCLALVYFRLHHILFIIFFKIIIVHLFKGTLFSFPVLISLSGNLFFVLLTYPLVKIGGRYISLLGISVMGAFFHNIGQIAVGSFFLPSFRVALVLGSILILVGLVTGIITGIITNNIYKSNLWRRVYGRSEVLFPRKC